MPTYKERIEKEKDNFDNMYLYSDGGLFFHLYDHSAFAFCSRISQLKVHVKKLKAFSEPYLYIGFPVNKKDNYLSSLNVIEDCASMVTIKLDSLIDIDEYQTWKNNILLDDLKSKNGKENNVKKMTVIESDVAAEHYIKNIDTQKEKLIDSVLKLNIASMTPMEAMVFLNDLQKKLRDCNITSYE